MRDYRRINQILSRIRVLWHNSPDWRLMQLLTNVIGHGGDHYYIEDDVLEKRLREKMRDWGVQLELPVEEVTTDG